MSHTFDWPQRQLKASIDEITETILSENRERFIGMMARGKGFFADDEDILKPFI